MKVFWSWQSDHPGKVSRHFVREALEDAILKIKQDPEIEDAARDAELDHDRKGVPGSPDLARIILEKISNSDVFIADVTPVGNVAGNPKKRLINSNVAIELGYALGTLTDRAMLMVLNEAYGTRDELPFDLKHKAGPITYSLPATATKNEIERENSRLVAVLRSALSDILAATSKGILRPFEEARAAADNPGRFFEPGEVLAKRREKDFTCMSDNLLYVRVIPQTTQPMLRRSETLDATRTGNLSVLNLRCAPGWSNITNKYGTIVFDGDYETGQIRSGTQLFKTREIWGFDAYLLSRDNGKAGVPTGLHEYVLADGLQRYLEFAQTVLKVVPPFTVEIGATKVDGYVLCMNSSLYPWDNKWGPIHDTNVVCRKTVTTGDKKEVDAILLDAFELIFDAAGKKRPEKYNHFPGDEPGALPF